MTDLRDIHSSFQDYIQCINLYCEHKNKRLQSIPVNLYQWFNANMAAPLGGVLDLLIENTNEVIFEYIDSNIKKILQKNGFLSHFGYVNQVDNHNTTIKYQKMKPEDGRYFREYVSTQFVNRAELPSMSVSLRKRMIKILMELFVNAQMHSKTKHIYTCGQFFPKHHTIEFCIVDTGIGFRQNFISRFERKISSVDAIRWAIKDRTTTKVGTTGGMGLAILHEFIQLNKGKLQIISHDGFYEYDNSENLKTFENHFPGTIVNVLFRTDDTNNYSLASEKNITDLF